jgi:Ni,Fe-hydrogenase I cytochrome b subunit
MFQVKIFLEKIFKFSFLDETQISISRSPSLSVVRIFLLLMICFIVIIGLTFYIELYRRQTFVNQLKRRHSNIESQSEFDFSSQQ